MLEREHMKNTCPRCHSDQGLHGHTCFACRVDIAFERAMRVSIPEELWPIEGATDFREFVEAGA